MNEYTANHSFNLMDAILVQNPTKLVNSDSPTADKLIAMWVHGKSPHTQRYYLSESMRFLQFVNKPLDRVTLQDTQAYADYLAQGSKSAGSQRRSLSAVKSLFTFAQRKLGILPVNAAAPVTLPKQERKLAERILPKNVVEQLISLEPNKRNQILLKLLYKAGLRVSELCALKWRNLQPRFDGGQVTVFGKGGKTRAVLLTIELWQELMELRGAASMDEQVFVSRKKHGHLNQPQINKIVKAAAS